MFQLTCAQAPERKTETEKKEGKAVEAVGGRKARVGGVSHPDCAMYRQKY
jgi:hypothetical protein